LLIIADVAAGATRERSTIQTTTRNGINAVSIASRLIVTGKLLKREVTRLFVRQQIQPTLSVLAPSTRDTGYDSVFPNAANFFVDLHSSLNIIVALV
jgi:hypothetical protein